MIKENICFKGTGGCIDLILPNSKYSFQYSLLIETGSSDHHHLIFDMVKTKALFILGGTSQLDETS